MSLLDGLFAYETSISDLLNPELWLQTAAIGSRTASGETIGPYSAQAIPAYFAAIRAISEDVAKLPLVQEASWEGTRVGSCALFSTA
jgi:hypothetical protein